MGYATGAWWLKGKSAEEGLAFIREGIENNPTAFQLHLVMAQLLINTARQQTNNIIDNLTPEVTALLQESRLSYHEAARHALAQRPAQPDFESGDLSWTLYLEDDAFGAARMSALMEQKYGDPNRAEELAVIYRAALGEDPVLDRIANSSQGSMPR
jgi:hypothetical protein